MALLELVSVRRHMEFVLPQKLDDAHPGQPGFFLNLAEGGGHRRFPLFDRSCRHLDAGVGELRVHEDEQHVAAGDVCEGFSGSLGHRRASTEGSAKAPLAAVLVSGIARCSIRLSLAERAVIGDLRLK